MVKATRVYAMTQMDVQGCSWFASPRNLPSVEMRCSPGRKPSIFCEAGKVAASWPNIYKFTIGSTAKDEESGAQDFFSLQADGGNTHTHDVARFGEDDISPNNEFGTTKAYTVTMFCTFFDSSATQTQSLLQFVRVLSRKRKAREQI